MERHFLTLLHTLICSLRIILFPFTNFILPIFSPWVKARLVFERKNSTDLYSKSFRYDGKKADVTFEVSSEGELEQVRPLIDQLLTENFLVELIYASESVERKCELLAQEYRGRLRILRLPILSFFVSSFMGGCNFFRWRTGRILILCRYDFYPELMLLGGRRNVFFILLSGTLKNKEKYFEKIWHPVASYLRQIYAHFDIIVAASQDDEKRFLNIGYPSSNLRAFDFRVLQILKRLLEKEHKFAKIPSFAYFRQTLERFPYERRLILGSAWPNEMEMFRNPDFLKKIIDGYYFVNVAPHKLSEDSIALIKKTAYKFAEISGYDLPLYVWSPKMTEEESRVLFAEMAKKPGILINTFPGVLCELYTLFAHAFVGGGHGRSIHSVLEPYVAGATVYCGPKIHRSTEFDLVKKNTPHQMQVIEELSSFYPLLSRFELVDKENNARDMLFDSFKKQWKEIYSLVLLKLGKHDGLS